MVIVKENAKGKSSLKESLSLEDVIGLSGFKGYSISGKLFATAHDALVAWRGSLTLAMGPGVSTQDVRLLQNNRVGIVSFPAINIKSISMKQLDVIFLLKDGTTVEFFRS